MKKRICTFLALCGFAMNTQAQDMISNIYTRDFDYFWNTVKENYCYWDKKMTDWDKTKAVYRPLTDTITSKGSFIGLLEKALYELYDHHASLSANTAESQRLVPSGSDIWAEYKNGKAVVLETRKGSGADRSGIHPGMEVLAFNDIAVGKAIEPFLPKTLLKRDPEAMNYALRVLLAGKHSEKRKITLAYKGKQETFYPDAINNTSAKSTVLNLVENKIIPGNIGYILINNRLWDNATIPSFDSAITRLRQTNALILDLRQTPSGGNTSVAKAILGSFIRKEGFYQKHELTADSIETGIKRSWIEIVSPREHPYLNTLIVLVDHWTGSVAEGITIGFDALHRATIMGTEMARLNGAVYSFTMPATGIGFNLPAEKLFHVNGQPRENYEPGALVPLPEYKTEQDIILEAALKVLRTKKKNNQ
ncbi:MAG: peptidase [Sediminibacterium sp.]|nr:peptidase [Sediminibacterium sp.]